MRILVVEDDHTSREVLAAMLAKYGQVETAVDGTEAMGKFKAARKIGQPYEVIFLDIMMPGLDGREVLREIRRLEEKEGLTTLQGVKIVMATAINDYQSISASFKDQCDGYLTKPISKKQVESILASFGFF